MTSQEIPRATRANVSQYLLPGEKSVVIFRKHPAVLIRPVCQLLACSSAVGVALNVADVIPGGDELLAFVGTIFVLSSYFLVRSTIQWWHALFVVTHSRVIFVDWRKRRKLTVISVAQVTDLNWTRSFTARLFGYGCLEFITSGNSRVAWRADHIPYPGQVFLELVGIILPEEGAPAPDWPATSNPFWVIGWARDRFHALGARRARLARQARRHRRIPGLR
jgi:hypothetical protein